MYLPVGSLFSFEGLKRIAGFDTLGDSLEDDLPGFLEGGSLLAPIGGFLALRLFGPSLFRSMLPLLLLGGALYYLGSQHSLTDLFSSQMKSATTQLGLGGSGLIPFALAIGALFLVFGARLFSLRNAILLGLAAYPLLTSANGGGSPLSSVGLSSLPHPELFGAAAFFLARMFLSGGRSVRVRHSVPLAQQLTMWLPYLKHAAVALAGVITLLMLANAPLLDHTVPGWRTTYGVAFFFLSLLALGSTLPQQYRAWLVPAFWMVVCIIAGAQLSTPSTTAIASAGFTTF